MSHNQSGVPTPIPTPASAFTEPLEKGWLKTVLADVRLHEDAQKKIDSMTEAELKAFVAASPSTEESGEPVATQSETQCRHCNMKILGPTADNLYVHVGGLIQCPPRQTQAEPTPASESADYLRGKLEGFNEGVEAAALEVRNNFDLSQDEYEWRILDLKRTSDRGEQ